EGYSQGTAESGHAQVLTVEDGLGLHQLLIKALEGQLRREDRMLDVEEPVVEGGELARFGDPGLGPGVRGIDGEVDDLGDARRPFPHASELVFVPAGISDNVDGYYNPQGPRHL